MIGGESLVKKSIVTFYDKDKKVIKKLITKGYTEKEQYKKYGLRYDLHRLKNTERVRIKDFKILPYENKIQLKQKGVFKNENY